MKNAAQARITPNTMLRRLVPGRASGSASVSVDSVIATFASQINTACGVYIPATITFKQGIRHIVAKLHEVSCFLRTTNAIEFSNLSLVIGSDQAQNQRHNVVKIKIKIAIGFLLLRGCGFTTIHRSLVLMARKDSKFMN